MGTRLPIYPYHVGRGRRDRRNDPESPTNKRIKLKFEEFADYLGRDDVRRCARNVILSPEQAAPWVQPATFDKDAENHAGLEALINSIGKRAAIAIPNITHIIGREKDDDPPSAKTRILMRRIHLEDIEVFPMVWSLYGEKIDLYSQYVRPGIAATKFFDLIPRIARDAVTYLNHAVVSRHLNEEEALQP